MCEPRLGRKLIVGHKRFCDAAEHKSRLIGLTGLTGLIRASRLPFPDMVKADIVQADMVEADMVKADMVKA
jgi:hypothetical protein